MHVCNKTKDGKNMLLHKARKETASSYRLSWLKLFTAHMHENVDQLYYLVQVIHIIHEYF